MKLTAEIEIKCSLGTLLSLTQLPSQHQRWDLRFSEIKYLPKTEPDAPQRFEYTTRLGLGLAVQGWGETIMRDNCQTSALRFGSDDFKSLIRVGSGCWVYKPGLHSVNFSTTYDYQVRYGWWGRVFNLWIFRPAMIWATRWSFDRLRLWVEQGLAPETTLRLWLLKMLAVLTAMLVVLFQEINIGSHYEQNQQLPGVAGILSSGAIVVTCLAVIWALQPLTPKASRASFKQQNRKYQNQTLKERSYESNVTL